MSEYNTWFKRIRMALLLDRKDVVQIMDAGGMPISNSTADGWARGEADRTRKIEMTRNQFNAFTCGLAEWSKR